MNRKPYIPIILVLVLFLLILTACGGLGRSKNDDGNKTQEPVVVVVTATSPAVVETEAPAVVATEAPLLVVTEPPVVSDEPLDYFIETFTEGLGNWSYFIMNSTPELERKAEVYGDDRGLRVKLDGYNIWYYLLYDPFTYGDVRIDTEVQNGGVPSNSVSLVCRYDDELGWYEFNISSDGTYNILYYDAVIYKGYKLLADGASKNINLGRDKNIYTIICQDRSLSLYTNDVHVKTVEHKDLTRGLVGIGLSSYESYPVIMTIPWFEISQP
ncbi:MAG: hypothetical protein KBD67_06290 [Anaerolineaceae bacterium]|nr:hypothetical protein [Anaerolineaceae bacterium]